MTTILVYAPIQTGDLRHQLGKPEYSYAFVLDHFRPVLEQLGTVVDVSHDRYFLDPLVDPIFEVRDGRLVAHEGGYSAFAGE